MDNGNFPTTLWGNNIITIKFFTKKKIIKMNGTKCWEYFFSAQNYIIRYYVECGGLFDILKDHDLFNDDDHLAVLY